MSISNLDIVVFILYCLLILFIGLYVSRDKKGKDKSAEDYFLAGKSLPWWAIGASLIAANISAEQFVAMNGSGFAAGLAIASYEWMAAITLLVVGKYFLQIFICKSSSKFIRPFTVLAHIFISPKLSDLIIASDHAFENCIKNK